MISAAFSTAITLKQNKARTTPANLGVTTQWKRKTVSQFSLKLAP
jgi:hypothetical protein